MARLNNSVVRANIPQLNYSHLQRPMLVINLVKQNKFKDYDVCYCHECNLILLTIVFFINHTDPDKYLKKKILTLGNS